MHCFVHFSYYRGKEEKMQALFLDGFNTFAFDIVQKICQTGYKRGKCTKTTVQILLLLLKGFPKKQYF